MHLQRATFLACLFASIVMEASSVTFDVSFVWFEHDKTAGSNYTARSVLPDTFENASRIQINQKVPVLLRSFDLTAAKRLRTLILDNCALNDMEIGSLNKIGPLDNLTITRNNIKMIRDGLFNKRPIRHVDLSHNKIATIAATAFNDMEDLLSLNLDSNELSVYALWFQNCASLHTISAQNNFLQYLPNDMFKQLVDRKISVYFSFNRISRIHSSAFQHNRFDDLFLDHNEITTFDNAVKEIETLNMNVNDVTCLSEEFLEKEAGKIKRITLYENPFTCTCYNNVFKLKNILVGRPIDC